MVQTYQKTYSWIITNKDNNLVIILINYSWQINSIEMIRGNIYMNIQFIQKISNTKYLT